MEIETSSIDIKAKEKHVAKRIQEERISKKLSQMELALMAGISQGYLAMIESNKKIPTITTLFKIAKALNIEPSSLINNVDEDRETKKRKLIDYIQRNL